MFHNKADSINTHANSGILPINTHAEVSILNLNYIDSFIFYSSLLESDIFGFGQLDMVFQGNFSILSDWSCMYNKLHKRLGK